MGIQFKKHDQYPDQIVIRTFEGRIELNDILNSWRAFKEHPFRTEKTIGLITDLTNCDLAMDMAGFQDLMSYLNTQDYLKQIKIAVLTDSPKTIVFPMLGESQEKSLKIKPFCVLNNAVHWILQG